MSNGLYDYFKDLFVKKDSKDSIEELLGKDWDYLDEPTVKMVCECGASKTPNPNLHATWCPLFIDPRGY